MAHWRVRDERTGLFTCGGIDAEFEDGGRTFANKLGAKGTLFHFVYGFRIDGDGVRRFQERRASDSVDDFEAVRFEGGEEAEVIQGRAMFSRNQLLNKADRMLDDLAPAELAEEMSKRF